MNLTITTPDVSHLAAALRDELARAFTGAMRKVTRQTEKELEALTVAAGLSKRISRTWQSEVYPSGFGFEASSLNPAGVIWSTAPGPMRAFTEGAVIKGKDGGFLAIPTDEVLKVRGRGINGSGNQRITPGGFTRATGIKLYLVKGGNGVGFLVGERAIGGGVGSNTGRRGGFRAATKGRLRKGARTEKFLAFTLVRQVTIRRRFDIKAVHRAWAAALKRELGTAARDAIGRAQIGYATKGRIT